MAFDLGGGGKVKVRPTMNVTPLVDVVLVLLIIFMVVTPLLTKRFTVHLPPKETAEQPRAADEPQIILQMSKDGALKLNGEPIQRAEVGLKLTRMFAARDADIVFFDADDDAPYGEAVQVMDLARGSGAVTIGLLTESIK